jgi:hypothetical protein
MSRKVIIIIIVLLVLVLIYQYYSSSSSSALTNNQSTGNQISITPRKITNAQIDPVAAANASAILSKLKIVQ